MSTTTLILIFLFTTVIVYFAAKEGAKYRKKSEARWKNAASKDGNETGGGQKSTATTGASDKDGVPGEVLAAIFMALHEEQEVVHDYENTVLTMDRVIRNYSPWNSKLYGLRQLPRR